MIKNICDLPDDEMMLSGCGSCAGCPASLALRIVGKALGSNAIMLLTPSCSVASMGMTPKTSYNWPSMNITFASAGASAAGVSVALDVLIKKNSDNQEKPTVFNWTGDGGTYDIGFQALSAAAERNNNFIHFCYNNEAYVNTGMQRSGATPRYCYTTTTPGGKRETKKNMALLMLEHNIPYVATGSIAHPIDLYNKIVKAKSMEGLKYIEIFTPCNVCWGFPPEKTIEMGKMGVETGAWLLWEAENGKIVFSEPTKKILKKVEDRPTIDQYLDLQGRYKKILKNRDRKEIIKNIQQDIDTEISFINKRAKICYQSI